MSALVVRGDARRLPLPDESVDLVVTSPPYFALRSYTDGGEHYAGQIGSEPTPAEYIANLIQCTAEWSRVLKPSGSLFVNLGDKYSDRANGGPSHAMSGRSDRAECRPAQVSTTASAPSKSLLMLPERYRIACVDQLGLIVRKVIIWDKPNALPESVTDRVRSSHEDWVHLVKRPRYFAAIDEIREPHARQWGPGNGGTRPAIAHAGGGHQYDGLDQSGPHQLGALPGSVWRIATEPLQVPAGVDVDHFAAFPSEWPRRLILGWSPHGICTACEEGRRPVACVEYDQQGRTTNGPKNDARRPEGAASLASSVRSIRSTTITGYACACTPYTDHPERRGASWRDHSTDDTHGARTDQPQRPAGPRTADTGPVREYHLDRWTPPPTRPAVVLDPFGGTGTTGHVADALGRVGISVDLSHDYCRQLGASPVLAATRRRKVLGLDKARTPEPTEDRPDIFALMAEEGTA